MYAIVKTGGKQYKVEEGDVLQVEKLEGKAGDKVSLDEVLSIGGDKPVIGAPLVKGAAVEAEIVEQGKGDKVIIFKKKRRQNYRRKNGHRQPFTELKVIGISADGKKAAPKKAAAKADVKEEKTTEAKKPSAKKPTAKKAPAKKAENKAADKKTTAKKAPAKKAAAKKDDK